jgi:HEPN domain-containing protein
MSNLRQSSGDDYPDAAAKHAEDALVLLNGQRYDGAGYLAGYAVECILKTIVQLESGQILLHHRLTDLSRDALNLASMPAARTSRYVRHPQITNLSYGLPNGWQETLRYRSTGEITGATATAWVEEARRLFNETIIPMRLDGVITP